MSPGLVIAVVAAAGLLLGWWMHRRSTQQIRPALERLAVERDSRVEAAAFGSMPKLRFAHDDLEVEVSSASTGSDGRSSRYTYALVSNLDLGAFGFRIRPRSVQTIGDDWLGIAKPMTSVPDGLDERLAIYTDDEQRMRAVLTERVLGDLASWAKGQQQNRIQDIRTYDDKLLYAVSGTLRQPREYRQLVESACHLVDALEGNR